MRRLGRLATGATSEVARWASVALAVALLVAWLLYASSVETDHPGDDSRVFWGAAALCVACAGLGLTAHRR